VTLDDDHLTFMFLFLISVFVFNTAFINITVILWQSVLLMEETGVTRETTDLPQVTDKILLTKNELT
jgi:hypothetical protein